MQKIITILFCLFLSVNLSAQQPATDKRLADLDKVFEQVLTACNASGFSVAVVNKDKVIYSKGFGFSNYEDKVPATANTVFAIGSCTKAFTASLIGMLEKEGKLELDKPVLTYLPGFKFYNQEMDNNITLRDMMCHRTGLPRYDFSWYLFASADRDSLVSRIQYMKPTFGIREKWQYNNFMFLLQGVITAKITGNSWENNIRERILKPLGMNNSTVSLDEWKQQKDIATGYNVIKDSMPHLLPYYNISGMAPAGSINSSANDMGNWLRLWIGNGKFNGKQLLPAAYLREAISSQMVITGGFPTREMPDNYISNYGFGWMLASYRGHYRVEHGGNIDGFSASTCFFPTDSIGIVVLCNQNSSTLPAIVRNIIADRMLELKFKDWLGDYTRTRKESAKKAPPSTTLTVPETGKPASHPAADYSGIYHHPGFGNIQVVAAHDSLYVFAGMHKYLAKHLRYDVFELRTISDEIAAASVQTALKLMFQMDDQGNITSISTRLEPTTDPLIFTKIPIDLTANNLKEYTGDYDLMNTLCKVYIKNNKALYLLVTGQPEYELLPISKDKFTLKSVPGITISFNRNDKNAITELVSIQPNGTFKANKKDKPAQ